MKIPVFISYFDKDKRKLEILRKKLIDTNYFEPIIIADRKEPMKSLISKVITGIKSSKYFIPILTIRSINEQWINQEIGYTISYNENNQIKIYPIIEKKLLTKLKGFVHKEFDLPFLFNTHSNKGVENKNYSRCIDGLILHLTAENKAINPSDVFIGKWKNECSQGSQNGSEIFFIKDQNKYFTGDQHWFNIIDFKFDEKGKTLSFNKIGIKEGDNRKLVNNLKIINNELFEGEEIDNSIIWEIKYSKQ